MVRRRCTGLAVPLLVAACTAAPPGTSPGAIPPRDCRLLEAGTFSIRVSPNDTRFNLRRRLEGLGYDSARDVKEVRERFRNAAGTMSERVVGYDGVGLRWNDPACKTR